MKKDSGRTVSEDRIRRGFLETPIGLLQVSESRGAIIDVRFAGGRGPLAPGSSPELKKCLRQLREYFSGQRKSFNLNLAPNGTDFEKRVWAEVLKVRFGETSSYGAIASTLGREDAARAVGGANGKNPIVVIIPCHRVLGSGGGLVGYGGGLWRKKWLLGHEQPSLKLKN
jgi:methylated-DNA-[protein]-cysteine S-methyltransferase